MSELSQASQAERTAMETAINAETRALEPDGCFEAGWIAARDYGSDYGRECERALEGGLRRLLVSALPTRTEAERNAAVENALDLLAASPAEREGDQWICAWGHRFVVFNQPNDPTTSSGLRCPSCGTTTLHGPRKSDG